MGLKWTVFLVLGLSVAAWGFDLRRLGAPKGHLDLRNDKGDRETSVEVKEDHVEHPIPPSGPMSRIVLEEKDEEGKAHPTTVDLVMDVKDSAEKASKEEAASSKENLAEKIEDLKEAATNGKVEQLAGGAEDMESTTEKLESSHEGLKDLPLDKAGSTEVTTSTSTEKRDLKRGVVNAFHHSISGNRKDYFRNAVSMMSKEELDDLHDVLSRALKPLPDDDVKVDDVKEDFKEVVHELVEKQAASSDISEEKKEALMEIEHVLEEAKAAEETEDVKQVIKMKDWKKENIVGGIAQKTEDLNKDTELPKPNVGLPIPAPEEKGDLKEGEEAIDKKDDKEMPAPTEEVKEVVIDKIPDVPDVPEEKEEESKPMGEVPEEIKEKVKELAHTSGILGGILSKEEQDMLEGKKEEASTEEEDSVIQPDEQKEEVIVVPLKASSEESEEEEEKPKSQEGTSTDEPIEDKLILSPSKVLRCQTSSDESSDEDSKGVDEKSGGRGWGRGGSGRRNRRHSGHHNRRGPRGDGAGPDARRTRKAINEDGE